MRQENIKGDLLTQKEGILAHQTNCRSIMGSGVALQVRNKFPKAYTAYMGLCNKHTPEELLGSAQIVKITDNLKVANIFGQKGYGYGEMHTNYKAVRSAFEKLARYVGNSSTVISIPYKMGCDRGGGDWETYKGIILETFEDTNITLKIYEYRG